MVYRFVASDKNFPGYPGYIYKQVLVYHDEAGIPLDTTMYRENGKLRLTKAGWQELKEILAAHKNVEVVEK